MRRLLVFAGAWGWGPITTAEMIVRNLGAGFEFDLVASGTANRYAEFSRMPVGRMWNSVAHVDSLGEYDAVLSVVEPVGPLVAKIAGIPLIAMDNLYWHWHWSESLAHRLRDVVADVSSLHDVESAVQRAAEFEEYSEYALMYVVEGMVLWQRVAGVPATVPSWMRAGSRFVEPLVERGAGVGRGDVERLPMLSLSGGLVNPFSEDWHYRSYCDLLGHILPFWSGQEDASTGLRIAAPEELHADLGRVFPQADVNAYSRSEFLDELSRTSVLFAPAGLATTFECVAARVPLVTLPEQHDGNYANYSGLASAANVPMGELERSFPSAMLETYEAKGSTWSTDRIFSAYTAALRSPSTGYAAWAREQCVMGFREASRMVGPQADVVRRFAGDMRGVEQTVTLIRELFS